MILEINRFVEISNSNKIVLINKQIKVIKNSIFNIIILRDGLRMLIYLMRKFSIFLFLFVKMIIGVWLLFANLVKYHKSLINTYYYVNRVRYLQKIKNNR
jgi:hypothetical protein